MKHDLQDLITSSEMAASQLISLRAQAFDAFNEEVLAEQGWNEAYYEFLLKEDNYEPPGGGRWNDSKRLEFAKTIHAVEWNRWQLAKTESKRIDMRIKQEDARVANINRIIRILQMTEVEDDDSES